MKMKDVINTLQKEGYESLEYLLDIKNCCICDDSDIASILTYIGYILADNGYQDAREMLDYISENIE